MAEQPGQPSPAAAAKGCAVVFVAGLFFVGWCSSRGDGKKELTPDVPQSAMAAVSAAPAAPAKPPTQRVCKFAGPPGAGIEVYPLFAQEEGVDSGVKAFIAAAGDKAQLLRFIANTGTVLVARDTTCAFENLELFGPSQVRLLSGQHVGRIGWVPTEWVNVEEPIAPAPVLSIDPARMAQTGAAMAAEYAKTKAAGGSAKELCTRAGFTMAAFMGAKDAAAKAKWRAIEVADCKRAGVAPLRDE